jgi:hypothetical protein
MQRDTLGGVMSSLINWFNNLSRNTRILLIIAVCLFTPIVGFTFNIVFSVIGLVISLLNWKGVLFFFIVGMFFAVKALYTWVYSEEEEDTQVNTWDPFN